MVSDQTLASLVSIYITTDHSERVVMVAVGLAESGGNERAHNSNASTRDDSYGLFQINMYGDLGPRRRQQYGLRSNAELYDPNRNVDIAGKIYRSQGKSAWGTYTSGAYRQYTDRATAAVGAVTGSGGLGSIVEAATEAPGEVLGALNPLDDMYRAVAGALSWVGAAAGWIGDPHNWVRVLQVGGGIVLALVAVNIFMKPAIDQVASPIINAVR